MIDDYVNKTRCQWQRLMASKVHKNLVPIPFSNKVKFIILQF